MEISHLLDYDWRWLWLSRQRSRGVSNAQMALAFITMKETFFQVNFKIGVVLLWPLLLSAFELTLWNMKEEAYSVIGQRKNNRIDFCFLFLPIVYKRIRAWQFRIWCTRNRTTTFISELQKTLHKIANGKNAGTDVLP